jgi:hypothetical protein
MHIWTVKLGSQWISKASKSLMLEELKRQAMTQMNFELQGTSKVDYKHKYNFKLWP